MEKKTKKWVEFMSPGSFTAESWTKELWGSPDIRDIEFPENAYAFQVWEREDIHDADEVYKGQSKKISPLCYHPDSKIETLEQVKENPKASDILLKNMEVNGWSEIIWTRWGNWPQPVRDDVKIMS